MYNEKNITDMNYLQQTGFIKNLQFNNNSNTMLPFLKICSEIQELVNEDITTSNALHPIYYLTRNGVKLQDARNINNFINFGKLHSIFRNKNKKRRLDVFANSLGLILIPKLSMNMRHHETETSHDVDNIVNDNNGHILNKVM